MESSSWTPHEFDEGHNESSVRCAERARRLRARGFPMTPLLEWLLDLENIRLGHDRPISLDWNSPWQVQPWMLVCLALVVAASVALVYRRENASLFRRSILAGIRCATMAFAIAMFCGPLLVLQRDRVEPSYVVLALDTSMSMAEHDRFNDSDLALSLARGAGLQGRELVPEYSRLELAIAALLRDGGAPLQTLLEQNGVQLCTFSGSVETHGFFDSPSAIGSLVEMIGTVRAHGTRTDLAGAVDDIVQGSQGRRLAAIVVVSDGRATQSCNFADTIELAKGRQVPVYALRIGSPDEPQDIEVTAVLAHQSVFANDLLAVTAQLQARGLSGPTPLEVRLVDERTGATVDTRQIVLDPTRRSMTVELRVKPTDAGRRLYRVDVPALPTEVIAENNSARIEVTVLSGQLRVLYCEGYPRYEYRYLKNALLRESTITLSVLLIEADEGFVQEGTEPIRRFPQSPEELNRYDVVIFGDVDPRGGWLSPAQMHMLLDYVGNVGGGFALIAGERASPHRFKGTPLEKLIPVRIDPAFFGRFETSLTTGFHAQLTSDGRRSRVFRFVPEGNGAEAVQSAFEPPSELYWFSRTLGPKPGATVLMEHPTARGEAGLLPLVVTGRYGAGKLFFQGTDDTWRWRRETGELLHDTYWVQVVRALMRGARLSQTRRLIVRTDQRSYAYGSPVHTQVRVFDSELLSELKDVFEIAVIGSKPRLHTAPEDGVQTPTAVARFAVHRLSADADRFEGTWIPPHPGRFVLEPAEFAPRLDETVPSVAIQVGRPNLETRHPQADHETLERLANATGGRVVELDRLVEAFESIEDRSVRIPDDVVEPLWDSKLALALFALMISIEWVARKAMGLL